jgi:cytochrome b561
VGFGTVSRLFHWVTVLLVAVMIPVGLVMTQDVPRSVADPLFILHKGLGPVVLVVVLARLGWRAFHPAPPLPASVPEWQARTAHLVHGALYFFLILQAVSGYVRVTTGGFPIEALNALGIPPLLPKAERVGEIASSVHAASAFCLIGLITVHVAAAAYHGIVRRDGVFSLMWPPVAPKRPAA